MPATGTACLWQTSMARGRAASPKGRCRFFSTAGFPGTSGSATHTTSPSAGFWEARADGAEPARPVDPARDVRRPDGMEPRRKLPAAGKRPFPAGPSRSAAVLDATAAARGAFGARGHRPDALHSGRAPHRRLRQQTATTIVRFDAQTGEFSALLGRALAGVLAYSPDGSWVAWWPTTERRGGSCGAGLTAPRRLVRRAGELALSPACPCAGRPTVATSRSAAGWDRRGDCACTWRRGQRDVRGLDRRPWRPVAGGRVLVAGRPLAGLRAARVRG